MAIQASIEQLTMNHDAELKSVREDKANLECQLLQCTEKLERLQSILNREPPFTCPIFLVSRKWSLFFPFPVHLIFYIQFSETIDYCTNCFFFLQGIFTHSCHPNNHKKWWVNMRRWHLHKCAGLNSTYITWSQNTIYSHIYYFFQLALNLSLNVCESMLHNILSCQNF